MTNDSNHGDTGRSDNTDVAPGFWRPGFPRHETGDQVRIGMEKIIADLPEPTGMTLMMMEDSDSDLPLDVSLGEKLRGRVQEMETCGRDGMAMGVSHTTCGRPDAWLPVRVFYCHQPGCPKCWFHRVSDDLEKHRDRLAAAFGDGYRMLRLDAPPGWGPNKARAALGGLLRRRTIKPILKPCVGAWLPVVVDGTVRYSITLIVPNDFPTEIVIGAWVGSTEGQGFTTEQPMYEADAATMDTHRRIGDFDALAAEGEWDPHPMDASTTLHELKTAADQAIPLLVASGHLDPSTAAAWMIEEANRPKLKHGGGFQKIAPAVKRDDAIGDRDVVDDPGDSADEASYYDDGFDDDACHDSPRDIDLEELGEMGHASDDAYAENATIPCPHDPRRCALRPTGRSIETGMLTEMGYEMTEFTDGVTLWERKERLRPPSD